MVEKPHESEHQDHLNLLLAVNAHFHLEANSDACLREVNFMAYELTSVCSGLHDSEIFSCLNKFIFTTKNFRLADKPIFLKPLLEKRTGNGLPLAFLYMHLANSLGLRLELIYWPLHTILKWVNQEGKNHYIDLGQKGRLLSKEELLAMINRYSDNVRTVSFKEARNQYLATIASFCRQEADAAGTLKALDFILQTDCENTRFLSERALLRRDLGMFKESLCDFKRYFAFTDILSAPPELVLAHEAVRSECERREKRPAAEIN